MPFVPEKGISPDLLALQESHAPGPPIAKEEVDATIEALRPPKRQRPLIAVVGINDASETTDYLMPFGILRRADVADVVALATKPGPMTLDPVLRIEPHATVGGLRLHTQGAPTTSSFPR